MRRNQLKIYLTYFIFNIAHKINMTGIWLQTYKSFAVFTNAEYIVVPKLYLFDTSKSENYLMPNEEERNAQVRNKKSPKSNMRR